MTKRLRRKIDAGLKARIALLAFAACYRSPAGNPANLKQK
jgi:hypothetical protein